MTRGLLLALAIAAAGCAKSNSHAEPKTSPGKAATVSQSQAPSIGSATMQADGTIVLQLRATDGTGMRGDARLTYPPGHAEYQKILAHLGGLKPGEDKPVPPWPAQ